MHISTRSAATTLAVLILAVPAIAAESTVTSTINCLAYLAADTEFKKADKEYKAAKFAANLNVREYEQQAISTADAAYDRKLEVARATEEETRAAADRVFEQALAAWKSRQDAEDARFARESKAAKDRYQAAARAHSDTWGSHDQAKKDSTKAAMLQAQREMGQIPYKKSPFPEVHEATRESARADANRVYREVTRAALAEREEEYNRIWRSTNEMRTKALEPAIPAYKEAANRLIDAYVAAYANPGPGLTRDVAAYDKELVFTMAESQRQLCPEAP